MTRLVVKPEGLRGCRCVQADDMTEETSPAPGTLCVASIDGYQRFCTARYPLVTDPADGPVPVSGAFLRVATPEDRKRLETNRKLAEKAMAFFDEETAEVPYRLRAVTATFDFPRAHLLVVYRSLKSFKAHRAAASLHKRFNAAVDVRQADIRGQVSDFGGIGPCGNPVCCARWLEAFDSLIPNLKLAKRQGFAMTPENLNGHCGRLKCCIRYEAGPEADGERPAAGNGPEKTPPR